MLAWFGLDDTASPGEADRLLADLARDMAATGHRVAGAIQINRDLGADCACDMDLIVLGDETNPIRISQSLGGGSSGCRLDTGALELAAARLQARMDGAALMILPKFGRQEAVGRGFRDVIGQAMLQGIPVLLHVPRQQRQAFQDFAQGMATRLQPADLVTWCHRQLTEAA